MGRTVTIILISWIWTSSIFCYVQTSSGRQNRPEISILFDEFEYRNERALFGRNRWTNLDGEPGPFFRLWYRKDWSEPMYAPDSRLVFQKSGQVGIETEVGHSFRWQTGYFPPIISSGFTARTGTWAARVRFDDISMGERTNTPIMQSFWTFSPNVACVTDVTLKPCLRSDKRWSEFDHEWNNFFNAEDKQYLASWGVVDGEPSALNLFSMRDPKDPFGPGLSCNRLRDYLVESIRDPTECMSWFVSNGKDDRYADLFIQYDGHDLVLEAIAWNQNSPEGAGDAVVMKRVVPLGRSTQPMISRFSTIGRTREQCAKARRSKEECWIQDEKLDFSIDWFFYSPATHISLDQVLDSIDWMKKEKLNRVNTLGIDTGAPFEQSSIHVRLEEPSSNDKREWVVVPSLRSTRYNRLRIRWRFRTRLNAADAWSAWSKLSEGGFTFDPHIKYEKYDAVDVEVTVSDWHNPSNQVTASGCVTDHGQQTNTCDSQPSYYLLGENYPDPFNSQTTITFELPKAGKTSVEVYNVIGQRVAVLANGRYQAGVHTVSWSPDGTPNGLYFYVLRSGLFQSVKQMVVVR
jgi:Secretion system C-terminal sorting domain